MVESLDQKTMYHAAACTPSVKPYEKLLEMRILSKTLLPSNRAPPLPSSTFQRTFQRTLATLKVGGSVYIVRRLVFGNQASPRCWGAVSGPICWIATRKLNIIGLRAYMDGFFGWGLAGDNIPFHGRLRPR